MFRTWSLPILLNMVVEKLKEQLGSYNMKPSKSLFSKLDDCVYNIVMDDGKIGQSWLRVFELSKAPRYKGDHAQTFRAFTRRPFSAQQSDSSNENKTLVSAKKEECLSFLSILREVEDFEELIPPLTQPLPTRPIFMPRLSTDIVPRTMRTNTDTAYSNALSDLVFFNLIHPRNKR